MRPKRTPDSVTMRRTHFRITVLTLTVVAGLGTFAASSPGQAAAPAPAGSGTSAATPLAVPPGWVGRKPPSAIASKIMELEASGALPTLDTSISVAGPDVDGNGIRDDIDRYIVSRHFNNGPQRAAEQMGRAVQGTLVVDTTNITSLVSARRTLATATKCLFDAFIADSGSESGAEVAAELASKLEQFTANTKTRLAAYLAFSKAVSGMATKEGACE